jgi:4-amino-4-deoxy-L-arabinose transferase-like glycosyltransferase
MDRPPGAPATPGRGVGPSAARLARSLRLAGLFPSPLLSPGGAVLLVAAFALVLFVVKLGSARTITFHESHIVQGAREMLRTGDWLVPRVGGRPWLEKPPLPQWSAAVAGAIAGEVDAFAARLPAALFGLAGVLAFTGMVARLRGPVTGLLSGLVLSSSMYLITYARLAEPDVFLWGIVVAALGVFARAQVGLPSPRAGDGHSPGSAGVPPAPSGEAVRPGRG